MPGRESLMFFVLLMGMPAIAQVQPSATGYESGGDADRMMTPPIVSGTLFPNVAGADIRTNYLSATLRVDAAYIDNVLPGSTLVPTSNFTYSMLSALTLNRTTSRQALSVTYSPGFTFFEPTSILNAVDQSAAFTYQARLSPHVAANVQNFFEKTSNVFSQSFPFSAGGIPGSTQTPVPSVILPFTEEITNTTNGAITYQFGRNNMMGAGGSIDVFHLPNPSQSVGVYDSNGWGGRAFYAHRSTDRAYSGLLYEYSRTSSVDGQYETTIHTALPYFTLYLSHMFSVSMSVGAQRVQVSGPSLATNQSWLPTAVATIGWQGLRGNLAASYLRTVTAGNGLAGAFQANNVNLTGGWKLSPVWTAALAASYAKVDPVTQIPALTSPRGNILAGHISLSHAISRTLTAEIGYDRLHESYGGIAAIAANPNSDRVSVTLKYDFRKQLGR